MPPNDPQFVTQDTFQKFGEQLVDVLGKIGTGQQQIMKHLQGSGGQPAKPNPTPAADPSKPPQDEVQAILNGLAVGDTTALTNFVKKQVEAAAVKDPRVDQLAAIASSEATERIQANQEHFETQIDKQYGPGAYQKYFAGPIAEKFKDQPGLQANRTYFQNVVNLVRGEQFDSLSTHQAAQQKEAAEKAAAAEKERNSVPYPFMLGGGSPISRDGKVQFGDDDRRFIDKFEDRNGTKFDSGRAATILQATTAATRDSGAPFVSVSLDQLQAALKPAAADAKVA